MRYFTALAMNGAIAAAVTANTPQMGWNSWNTFGAKIDQSLIEQTADQLVSTGLLKAGYDYLVVDDGWQNFSRAADGRQQPNTTRFPSGIASLVDYVHNAGLKFGIYSDAGILDCAFYPGSWGYEDLDAVTYAEWGVDYLKYDNCGLYQAGTASAPDRFSVMRDALLRSGRDIFFSLCEWGYQFPWFWADQVGQSYRMSGDITTTFTDTGADCACKTAYCLNTGYAGCSILTIIRKMREVAPFQKPGSFADMDMLEIGVANLTLDEQKTHFAFWAALKSPLIVGADLSKISNDSVAVLTNENIIAISQDSLGKAALYVPALSSEKSSQIWAGPLSGGRVVLLALNEATNATLLSVPLSSIPNLPSGSTYSIQDVWSGSQLTAMNGTLSLQAASHETRVVIIGPANSTY